MSTEAKYGVTPQDAADIAKRFTYHSAKMDQVPRYTVIRAKAWELATTLAMMCPFSRERSLALTKLEEAVMWANAAIARNESNNVQEETPQGDDQEAAQAGGPA